jgi:hypothetical protein
MVLTIDVVRGGRLTLQGTGYLGRARFTTRRPGAAWDPEEAIRPGTDGAVALPEGEHEWRVRYRFPGEESKVLTGRVTIVAGEEIKVQPVR